MSWRLNEEEGLWTISGTLFHQVKHHCLLTLLMTFPVLPSPSSWRLLRFRQVKVKVLFCFHLLLDNYLNRNCMFLLMCPLSSTWRLTLSSAYCERSTCIHYLIQSSLKAWNVHYFNVLFKDKLKFQRLSNVFITQPGSGLLPKSCFQPLFYMCSSLPHVTCPFLIGARIETMQIGVWPRTQAVSGNQRSVEVKAKCQPIHHQGKCLWNY